MNLPYGIAQQGLREKQSFVLPGVSLIQSMHQHFFLNTCIYLQSGEVQTLALL